MNKRGNLNSASVILNPSSIFFALFFLYLWLFVDLRLLYGGGIVTNFPVYFTGWAFLKDLLARPGGPLEYVAALSSQLFYLGWAGALVVTVQAWLISACVGYVFKALDLPAFRRLRFAPPVLLLITYTQYTYHFVTVTAFLAVLLFVCLYLRITASQASILRSFAVFMVLSVVLFYIVAGAYLLFALLCGMYELFFKRRVLPGLLCLLSAAAVPYVEGVMIFRASSVSAFTDLLPVSWKILAYEGRRKSIGVIYALYLLLPSAMLALAFWKNVLSRRIHARFGERRKKSKSGAGRPFRAACCVLRAALRSQPQNAERRTQNEMAGESLTLLAIATAAVFFSYNAERRTLSAVHYYACHEMWPDVLRAARRYPGNSIVVNAVDRALYHTGRLGYDMFRWPQRPDALLKTGKDQVLACWQKFDTQIDLGLINMAEKNLTECMEVFGEHPAILKRLALINMVKANYSSARIYLGALSKTLFHSDWADDYLARLRSDPNLSGDQRIQHLRSVCMKTDDPTIFFSSEKALCDLLEKNGGNRMAFEYLIAWYMLTRQLDNSVRTIERLGDFNYKELPTLYEEALLIYVYGTKKTVHLPGYETNPLSRQRIERFSQIFNGYGRNKQAAYGELAKDYGDSYFFYHIYGISGVDK